MVPHRKLGCQRQSLLGLLQLRVLHPLDFRLRLLVLLLTNQEDEGLAFLQGCLRGYLQGCFRSFLLELQDCQRLNRGM